MSLFASSADYYSLGIIVCDLLLASGADYLFGNRRNSALEIAT